MNDPIKILNDLKNRKVKALKHWQEEIVEYQKLVANLANEIAGIDEAIQTISLPEPTEEKPSAGTGA